MELIEGESVEQLVRRAGALNPRFALDIAGQIASALAAAAKLRLVHRDLKPSNVMLIRTEDGKASAKLIDFGVGLLLDPQTAEESARLTQAGLIGTAHFASPEQLGGQPVDARSDIYSLGVTLWFMLTGQTPFRGPSSEVVKSHLSTPPPRSELPRLPECVGQLLDRMLQKDPAARPQTAAGLQNEIVACLQQISTEPGDLMFTGRAGDHALWCGDLPLLGYLPLWFGSLSNSRHVPPCTA